MKTRILTGLALLAVLAAILYMYNYKLCIALIIIIVSIIQVEWEMLIKDELGFFRHAHMLKNPKSAQYNLKRYAKYEFFITLLMFFVNIASIYFIVKLCIAYFDSYSIIYLTALLGFLWLICCIVALLKPIGSMQKFARSMFYRVLPNFSSIAIVFACLIVLNFFNIDDTQNNLNAIKFNASYQSYSLLLLVLPLVWITDSAAYFFGRAFGKHKLAKNISPNKTIEGAIAGILIGTASVSAIYYATTHIFSWSHVIYFVLLSVVSILGDLFQSRLKREFNVKDSSNLLPGHGGFFDRFDAAIPVLLFSIYFPSVNIFITSLPAIKAW